MSVMNLVLRIGLAFQLDSLHQVGMTILSWSNNGNSNNNNNNNNNSSSSGI